MLFKIYNGGTREVLDIYTEKRYLLIVKERVALFNMPAAGKCRKGVLEMKKLLLLLLVPVLVLGVMVGCGKVFDGDPTPISLQGAWVADNGGPNLIVSGNQITLWNIKGSSAGNIAFRTNYTGDTGTDANGILPNLAANAKDPGQGTIEFYWFTGKNDLIGSIKLQFTTTGDFTKDCFEVLEVKYETWFQNVMLPIEGTEYTRLLQSSF
jgi:hypothetical protein